MSRRSVRANLKQRVSTRLAWLQLSQRDFAEAVGMDQSVLSRAIRANSPRQHTLFTIATGLGLTVEQLLDPEDRHILLSKHPAFSERVPPHERAELLQEWFRAQKLESGPRKTAGHRTDEERTKRRRAVRTAIAKGVLTVDTVQEIADEFGVSTSQIHSDRSLILSLEPALEIRL